MGDMYFYLNISVLSLGSFSAWYLICFLFGIDNPVARLILGIIIFVLAVSTFLASIVVNKKDTLLVRIFYIISCSWLGVLLNFGLTALVLGPLFWVLRLNGINLSDGLFRLALIVITIISSTKSFYNAYEIKVQRYTVAIKNLPSGWHNKRIIHISDVHLGPILREDFFHRVIRKIEDLKPDAVFLTGDLFDGSESDFSWVNSPLNNLNAPLGLYYSLGNHDFTLGADRVIELLKGEDIIVLSNRMIVKEGLQIIGLDFNPDRNFDLDRAILAHSGYSAAIPSILLFHEPKDTVKSQGVGIDLQLSGHTHAGQMFPFNFVARYFYHNHAHGLFRRGDYTLSVTAGVGTWGPPMRTGSRSEIVELTLRKK